MPLLNISVFSPFKTHHRQSYKCRQVLRFLHSFLKTVAGAHLAFVVDFQLSQSIIKKVHIAHTKDSFSIVDEQLNVNYYFNVWSACLKCRIWPWVVMTLCLCTSEHNKKPMICPGRPCGEGVHISKKAFNKANKARTVIMLNTAFM